MPSFRTGTVTAVLAERPGLQRVEVDGERAYVLVDLTGPVAVGDRVVVNTTAVDRSLGTGGWHVVHWNLARDEWRRPGPGHVMKLRYTSLQADTGSAEETEAALADAEDLDGMPVVACGLHSQVAAVAAAFKDRAPAARLVYVMTDGGALPLALSDLVADLCRAGLLDATVTAGQAFGGDREAVNVASALLVARLVLAADAAVVGMGPGVLGTATRLGFSALEVGPVLDAAAGLGGQPVVAPRLSLADPRLRHQGVSPHTLTALRLATHTRVVVPVPRGDVGERLRADLDAAGLAQTHRLMAVDAPDAGALLAAHGVEVATMGRTPAEDPAFFTAAAAAGALAAALLRP